MSEAVDRKKDKIIYKKSFWNKVSKDTIYVKTGIRKISLLSLFVVVFTPDYSGKNVGNIRLYFLNQRILRQLKTE